MGKCSALWNASSRPHSADKIYQIVESSLKTPCATRCNSLYDSIKGLLDKRNVLSQIMTKLHLPCFRDVDLEFLDEHQQILAPIAVALDRLQSEHHCYYADLIPTLHAVNNQLKSLQLMNFRHCSVLLRAVCAGFNHRFANFLNLTPDVNVALLASMTHPYFKIRWLPATLSGEHERLAVM